MHPVKPADHFPGRLPYLGDRLDDSWPAKTQALFLPHPALFAWQVITGDLAEAEREINMDPLHEREIANMSLWAMLRQNVPDFSHGPEKFVTF